MKNSFQFSILVSILFILRPAYSTPLSGHIEVREKLESLPANLKQGNEFAVPGSIQNASDWYVIPPWLSGKWQLIQLLQLSIVNNLTATESQTVKAVPLSETETFGYQRDRKGGIWNAARSYLLETSQKPEESTKLFRINSVVGASEDSFSMRTDDIKLQLNDKSRIKSALRTQLARTFRPLDSQTMVAFSISRTYDSSGLPMNTSKLVGIYQKKDDYSDLDSYDDHDLHASFSKFLQRTGHGNLLAP